MADNAREGLEKQIIGVLKGTEAKMQAASEPMTSRARRDALQLGGRLWRPGGVQNPGAMRAK